MPAVSRARLFTGPRGGRICTAAPRDATHWDEVVTKLGLEHLRRHDLRHTGLTWMADAGIPLHVLRVIAGHGSLMTTQRYLRPDLRAIAEAGRSLSAHLSGAPAPSEQLAASLRALQEPDNRRKGLNLRPLDPQTCVRGFAAGVHSMTTRVGPGREELSLRALIRDEMAASMPRSERLAAMRSARLYFQRPDEPGFLVSETEHGRGSIELRWP
ncbi:tyrosine-type recombinase/integrase [Streptomyces sp. NPDC056669]|uniref:tyrosine-type recombinase/integrase n=1 Tax=Streptomyces sp. NPDC056669 TaxID=3345903 RepID=UPI0036CBC36C